MAGISQKTIDQVNTAADITDVISRYIDINRNNKALCPFHDDTKPSLSILPERQIFNCFTCGKKGGTIQFIMFKENVRYPQAIEVLANMYNIVIEYNDKQQQQNYDEGLQMIEIHNIAKKLYHENLYSEIGKECLEYIQSRDISNEMIKEFELGYCPKNNNMLHEKVKGKFPAAVLEKTRLFIYNGKEYVDFFGGRFIIPILTKNGDTVAFNARTLPSINDTQKYKNSFDTIIYKKSNILYGLNKTKQYIKEKDSIIVVEGPTDLIRLYQNNVKNVVAIGGTAFNEIQARALKYESKNIYINLDSDEKFQGQKAASRAGYILFKNGIEPKIISLPLNSDPDDFIKEKGIDIYLEYINKSKKLIEFDYEIYKSINKENANPQGFVDKIKDEIISINNLIYREIAIQNLSKVINVSIESIQSSIQDLINKKNKWKKNTKNETAINQKNLLEDDFIRICISKKHSIRKFIFENINVNWMSSEIHRKLYEYLSIHLTSKNMPEMSLIISNIEEPEISSKAVNILIDIENTSRDINVAKDCLIRLEKKFIQKKLKNLREKLKKPDNDDFKIIQDISLLEQELKIIHNKYQDK